MRDELKFEPPETTWRDHVDPGWAYNLSRKSYAGIANRIL